MEELINNLELSSENREYKKLKSYFFENSILVFKIIKNPISLESIKSNDRACAGLFVVMSYFSENMNEINSEVFSLYFIVLQCYCERLHKSDFNIIEIFLFQSFNEIFIRFSSHYDQLAELYFIIESQFESNKFTVTKSILAYLSYKMNLPHIASSFVDSIYIKHNSDNYLINYSFIMLNYFRGVIQLAKRKFNEATANFLIAIKNESYQKNNYTYHQVESFKRLSLLVNILDPDLANLVIKCLGTNQIFEISGMGIYKEAKNLAQEKNASYFFSFRQRNFEAIRNDNLLVIIMLNKYIGLNQSGD